jgi:predicted HAD superfamily hydrolase
MRSSAARIRSTAEAAFASRWSIRNFDDLARFSSFKKASLVTLDVFDTALRRLVARPKDVFLLAAHRVLQKSGRALDPWQIAHVRESAETRSRARPHVHEVTLDDIYSLIAEELGTDLAQALRAEEIATEHDVSYANPDISPLYAELQLRNVPVAFVSDTYLPHEIIVNLLADNGYRSDHRVFASSTFNSTKSNGQLFFDLMDHLPVDSGSICHLGDYMSSDVINARRAGWHGFWYRGSLLREEVGSTDASTYLRRSLQRGIAHSLPQSNRFSSNPVWHNIAVEVAAPLYLGFTQWLIDQLRMAPVDRIYFCARDGKIIKEVYDRLRRNHPDLPPSTYLMISRRSLVFASIDSLGEDELKFLSTNWADLRLRDYLTRIRLNPDECIQVAEEHGLSLDTVIDDKNRTKLKSVFQGLADNILAIAGAEKQLLLQYLEEQGCLSVKRIGFCDIGWHGSLQQSFAKVIRPLNPDIEIRGFYVGTSKTFKERGSSCGSVTGWLLNNGEPRKRRAVLSGLPVLELLFTAQHGSVLGYRTSPEGTQPVLHEEGDTKEYGQAAAEIQASALAFIDAYIKAFGGSEPLKFDVAEVFEAFRRLAETPTRAEARAIGDLVHIDGFGETKSGRPLAKPPSLMQLLSNPLRLKDDFIGSHWQFGYLGRIAGSFAMNVILRGWRMASGRSV